MSRHAEDELLPISALQHLRFCERQAALIHVEGLWADDRRTVEGAHLHRTVHEAGAERRGDVRTVRGLALRSLRLGLVGQADAVEFHRARDGTGVALPGSPGRWRPLPVEYKRGRAKRGDEDRVQLAAQALCLEEMLGVPVPAGALFYGQTRRRTDVAIDDALRAEVERAAGRLRELVGAGITPAAVRAPKCDACSLLPLCLPPAPGRPASADAYLRGALATLLPGFVPDAP